MQDLGLVFRSSLRNKCQGVNQSGWRFRTTVTGSAYILQDFVHNLGIIWDSVLIGEAQTVAVTFAGGGIAGMMLLNDRKM